MKETNLDENRGGCVDEPEWSVDNIRESIDLIDTEIVMLLNKRLALGRKLGGVKKRQGLDVLDGDRERKVFERLGSINEGPLPDEDLESIFGSIISATRKIQNAQ